MGGGKERASKTVCFCEAASMAFIQALPDRYAFQATADSVHKTGREEAGLIRVVPVTAYVHSSESAIDCCRRREGPLMS
jgi:hypothetical protein